MERLYTGSLHTQRHEAAHAVACVLRGGRVEYATSFSGSDSAGHMQHAGLPMFDDLVVTLAGPLATIETYPHMKVSDFRSDWQQACELAEGEPNRRALLQAAADEAACIVQAYTKCIADVAALLAVRGWVEGVDIHAIVDRYGGVAQYKPRYFPPASQKKPKSTNRAESVPFDDGDRESWLRARGVLLVKQKPTRERNLIGRGRRETRKRWPRFQFYRPRMMA